ncbi:MAG: STT3 domain-containing protein [Pyrobaculum sp.]
MDRREKILLVAPALLAAFSIALYLRMYRVFLWGWWLDEFDPYVRYYLAKYTLQYGVGWWWSGAHFTQFWYPYGVDWGKVLLPGTSFYGLFTYFLLSPFGVDLWHAVIAAPAIFNSLAVFSMFYLGYRVGEELGIPNGGVKVGLLAALMTAISPAFIERGFAAWFDDEPISLFLIPLGLALLLDGLRRPWLGALAGAALGYVAWTWGAHFYVWNLVGLYALVLPLYHLLKLASAPRPTTKGRRVQVPPAELPFNTRNFFLSYLLFYAVYLVFVATIPRYGVHTVTSAFNILPTFGLAAAAVTWLLDAKLGVTRTVELLRRYIWYIVGVVAVGIVAFAAALATGAIGGKFLATLMPLGRSAIVASVAEHTTTTFTQIVPRYGPILPFIVASVPYLFTPSGFMVLTYLATAGYAAATMVRLLVLLAPAAILAAAVGVVKALESKRLGLLMLLAAFLSLTFLFLSVLPAATPREQHFAGVARQPTQIATSAVGAISADFLDALMWLKTRLPPYEPVASWWDYGYWISIIGNKTSLADNSTINATQIGKIGLGLMAPPQIGMSIFTKEFKTKYVLAIMPYTAYPLTLPTGQTFVMLVHEMPPGGDFLKSYWMAKIALENLPERAGKILGGNATNFDNFFYTKVMSYPGGLVDNYAYFTILQQPYPVPINLNRTLYTTLFSKIRLVPMFGNYSQYLPWVFEGVVTQSGFTPFRSMSYGTATLVGGNVYLPGYAPQLAGVRYVIAGWTPRGVKIVVDPLTGASEEVPYITAEPGPLRLVYVSKPFGWVVIYRFET